MADLDIDKLISAMGSDGVGKNANSVLGMLQEGNKLLSELDKAMTFLKKLESSILVSAVVKVQAKKAGIELTPLTNDNLIPQTEAHKTILEQINKCTPEQLKELVTAIQEYDGRKKDVGTRKPENK